MDIFSLGYLILILSVFFFIGSVLNTFVCPLGLLIAVPATWALLKYPVSKALDKGGKPALCTAIVILATLPANAVIFWWGVKQAGVEAHVRRNSKRNYELRVKRMRMQREAANTPLAEDVVSTSTLQHTLGKDSLITSTPLPEGEHSGSRR